MNKRGTNALIEELWYLGISFDFVEKSVSQVAIRWLLQSPPVTSVIVGTTKVHQLEDNMGAAGWRLTDQEVCTAFLHRSSFLLLSCRTSRETFWVFYDN